MSIELQSPEKKKCREKEGRTINIFTNIPEIPLRKVILRNGCHGLSPLDIKSLDTNINNNEKISLKDITNLIEWVGCMMK